MSPKPVSTPNRTPIRPKRARATPAESWRLTAAELARAYGVSDQAVSAWKSAGAPFGDDRKVSLAEFRRWELAAEKAKAAAKAAPSDIAEAERRKVIADAELAEHKLAQMRGEVVPVAEVEMAWARHLAPLRAKIAAIPGKWARALVGIDRPHLVQAALGPLVQELFAVLAEGPVSTQDEEAA